jgi:hypothetical protein
MVRGSIFQHGFRECILCRLFLRWGQDYMMFFPAHRLCFPEKKDELIMHGIISLSTSAE